ncbi:hypothetical protein SELMODRAFT_114490 [Selaginella moellendorffii]|uniref:Uncharacterized protein n=1 Tax=Selaginella moellendorffii TaxID=88036 RepID=D8SDM0_SELML|nr:hypothetical protein SELMODRAFT_114490 [Selaginella moellendorffii]
MSHSFHCFFLEENNVFLFFFLILFSLLVIYGNACNFEKKLCPTGIFSFSDSLSDTGNRNLSSRARCIQSFWTFTRITLEKPTERFCDGYDYLSRQLKLRDIEPLSLTYSGTYFTSLNFGYAGAIVRSPSFATPHILSADFIWHKQQVNDHQNGAKLDKKMLYEKALCYIEIGGNDRGYGMPDFAYVMNNTIPAVVKGIKSSIMDLYNSDAKYFMVMNLPRYDCAPS